MRGEYPLVYARHGIPQPHRAILTATCKRTPIGTERDASNLIHIPCEGPLVSTCHGIPQADGFVITPTGNDPTIRTEREAIDHRRMLCESTLVSTRHGIPQTDFLPTATCQRSTIRAERDAIDLMRMPGEQGDLLMGRRIIEPNTGATRHREVSAIRRIRDITRHPTFTEARLGPFG